MTGLTAYIPFITPLNMFHTWWILLILPLCVGIAIIYKALRVPSLDHFWREVMVMVILILLALFGMAIALAILVEWVLPILPAERM